MTGTLYNLGIHAYRSGIAIAAARNPKARALHRGLRDVFSRLDEYFTPRPDSRPVWVHAASLGEFEQARPLIEMIRKRDPEQHVILTFFSPSGYEVRKNWPGADMVSYLPMDTPANVRRFLDTVRPTMAIFVKYEFWRNYLLELERRAIPTYLISGIFRSGQLFFKPYGRWYRRLLRCFTALFLQEEGSRLLLKNIGVTNTEVCGDTRFDRVTAIRQAARPLPLLERFAGDAPIFMAGSSWPSDEAVYLPWLKEQTAASSIKAVIAPHEFDRQRTAKLISAFAGRAVSWTQLEHAESEDTLRRALAGKSVLVMDCFGLLSSAYRYASMAYVGGGFGAGIHNINEAAVYGIPVLFGPNNARFVEAAELQDAGGGFQVTSMTEMAATASGLLSDPSAMRKAGHASAEYILSKTGATARILSRIFEEFETR